MEYEKSRKKRSSSIERLYIFRKLENGGGIEIREGRNGSRRKSPEADGEKLVRFT